MVNTATELEDRLEIRADMIYSGRGGAGEWGGGGGGGGHPHFCKCDCARWIVDRL